MLIIVGMKDVGAAVKAVDLLKMLVLLFAIVDPFGNIPLFLGMTLDDSEAERRRMARRACAVSFLVLTLFALFGRMILSLFGVDVPAFQVAGGMVLLVFSLPMLTAVPGLARIRPAEEEEGAEKADVSIVPLAIPLLAGPGAITTMIVFSQQGSAATLVFPIAAAAAVLFLTYLMLAAAGRLARFLGATGINVLTRVMGLITLVIAVQFILAGARAFFLH